MTTSAPEESSSMGQASSASTTPAASPINKCGVCDTPATDTSGVCKGIYYCSKECQRKDWRNGHKLICKEYDKFIAENPRPRDQRTFLVLFFPVDSAQPTFVWDDGEAANSLVHDQWELVEQFLLNPPYQADVRQWHLNHRYNSRHDGSLPNQAFQAIRDPANNWMWQGSFYFKSFKCHLDRYGNVAKPEDNAMYMGPPAFPLRYYQDRVGDRDDFRLADFSMILKWLKDYGRNETPGHIILPDGAHIWNLDQM